MVRSDTDKIDVRLNLVGGTKFYVFLPKQNLKIIVILGRHWYLKETLQNEPDNTLVFGWWFTWGAISNLEGIQAGHLKQRL